MNFCSNCGSKLEKKYAFCPDCGEKVEGVEPKTKATKSKETNSEKPKDVVPEAPNQYYDPNYMNQNYDPNYMNQNYDPNYMNQNYGNNYYYYPVQESNGMATVGLVLSFFIPLLGLIFSIIGYSKSKYLNGKGRGESVAGITLSILFMVIGIIAAIIYLTNNSGHRYGYYR